MTTVDAVPMVQRHGLFARLTESLSRSIAFERWLEFIPSFGTALMR